MLRLMAGDNDGQDSKMGDNEDHFPESIELPITDSLDLHTFPPREARELVSAWLDEVWKRGFTQVRLIHGKGTGQLREKVHATLRRHPAVERFALDDGSRGGWGATWVWLKPRKDGRG